MGILRITSLVLLVSACATGNNMENEHDHQEDNTLVDEPLRIIAVFAHPDDGDFKMGATAALWAEMGHEVKFVSITNGDAGHYDEGGGTLAKRRRAEAEEAGRRLGLKEYTVLDHHDAELMPHLHIRKEVIKEIREWDADIVIGLRPNDYHPDHRYAGELVQDAAYMVIVPNIVTDSPPLEKNPVFLYMHDGFERPNPFQPDIAVDVTHTWDIKIQALDAHESQVYEWIPWTMGQRDEVPEEESERKEWLRDWIQPSEPDEATMESLVKWYGDDQASEVTAVESFEIAEYGHQPDEDEIRKLFPMLGQ